MANIYKLKRKDNGKMSEKNYTLARARKVRKLLEKTKKIETEVVLYKENVVIVDSMAEITGEIKYYCPPNERQLRQMTKGKD